jgi:molybdopterin converting factor small subunit
MPTATVRLSASLTYPEPEEAIRCAGSTVDEVLWACCTQRPRLQERILGRDGRRGAAVFLNGRSLDQLQGLQTEIHEGDTVLLLTAIAGG